MERKALEAIYCLKNSQHLYRVCVELVRKPSSTNIDMPLTFPRIVNHILMSLWTYSISLTL